jgi:hypothetical protein
MPIVPVSIRNISGHLLDARIGVARFEPFDSQIDAKIVREVKNSFKGRLKTRAAVHGSVRGL